LIPFVEPFDSVSKLDSESKPLLMCGTFERASVLNQSCIRFSQILDFTDFIATAIYESGNPDLTEGQIEDQLYKAMLGNCSDSGAVGTAGNVDSLSMCNPDSDPIKVTMNGAGLIVTFCTRISYVRHAKFDGRNLLQSIPEHYDIIADADLTFRVDLDLGATIAFYIVSFCTRKSVFHLDIFCPHSSLFFVRRVTF
jgi:hypothetical protein